MKIPTGPEALTTKWLNHVLHETGTIRQASVLSMISQVMGDEEGLTGSGQMVRLHLTYTHDEVEAPPTLIAKFSSPDPVLRAEFHAYELYEREVHFYHEIAHQVELRTPRCYYGALDQESGYCVLLLEDLAPVRSGGDNYALCSLQEAELAMRELARFHVSWWQSPKLASLGWLRRQPQVYQAFHDAYQQRWGSFLDQVGHSLAPPIVAIGEQFACNPGDYWSRLQGPPQTIIHNDYNLGNLLFLETPLGGLSLAVIDWQVVSLGHGLYDVALFLGRHLPPEDQRAKEMEFLKLYHTILSENGVQGYSFAQCLYDYRLFLLTDLWRAVFFIGGGKTTKAEIHAFSSVVLPRCSRALLDHQVSELLPK
ncbi:MAG: phosphotransferase [Caldilineaceae bacterium]|nr:phosphotransferase [Caldilineaceae bacterium]